jgi:lactoylglutathione lyase
MTNRLFRLLSAADLTASLRFYRDLLGGVEAYRFPEDDPAFVTLRIGDSVAAAHEHPVLLPPTDQPWGERIAYIADPDENLIMLAARIGQ